jgi:purine nucleosidase
LTNYALALKLDPEVATLAKEFVLMGGGFYADHGGIDPGAHDARREFNWWFDPEAAQIVLRAPWKKMTITPIDISVKTRLSPEIQAAIAKVDTPVTRYLGKYSLTGYMWDEIAGAALIDPSIITGQKATVHGHRHRSRRQLWQDPVLGVHRHGSSVSAVGERSIRYRRGEVL